jgi:hypothetical protein
MIDTLGGHPTPNMRNTGRGADFIDLSFERYDGIVRAYYSNIFLAPITKVHLTANEFTFNITDGDYPEIKRFVNEKHIKPEDPLTMPIKNIDWNVVAEKIARYFFERKDYLKENPRKILGME